MHWESLDPSAFATSNIFPTGNRGSPVCDLRKAQQEGETNSQVSLLKSPGTLSSLHSPNPPAVAEVPNSWGLCCLVLLLLDTCLWRNWGTGEGSNGGWVVSPFQVSCLFPQKESGSIKPMCCSPPWISEQAACNFSFHVQSHELPQPNTEGVQRRQWGHALVEAAL